MPEHMLPSRFMRKALPILLLSVSCALCACAGRGGSAVPADPDRERSQGAPLQSPPTVAEQRIGEPAQPQTPARQPVAAPQASPQRVPQARQTPTQTDSGYITLQPGETLGYISALYAVSENDLIAWNGLSSAHDVRAGQRLTIRPPGMQSAPSAQTGRTAASAPQPAAPVQAETASNGVIIVASGQSLSTIAQRHGVTVAQLREWNGLTSNTLRAGQRLHVQPPPARASSSIGTPVAEGRMVLRPPQEPAHGAAPSSPGGPDADGMITVRSGQTLSAIAVKYKVSTAELRQWNKLKSDNLKNGQRLRVKASARVHTVKAGESLGGIAAKYKVSTKALMQKNKLANTDVLPVGKELIIP
jgi:LysM repeat protein